MAVEQLNLYIFIIKYGCAKNGFSLLKILEKYFCVLGNL